MLRIQQNCAILMFPTGSTMIARCRFYSVLEANWVALEIPTLAGQPREHTLRLRDLHAGE